MGAQIQGFTVTNCWCLIELFSACNVTSLFWKWCDSPARNMLMAAPVAIKKCSLEFLSYNWRREDESVTTAAFTSWQSSFPVAVKTCMAHSHGSNWSLYQQMSGWEWDHCCSCNDERDCNVFQIFCSSACIKVISKTLCWSYQCLRTLQFVCHVGEVTETGIFVHHKSHANREGKLLQLKLTKNLISGRSC